MTNAPHQSDSADKPALRARVRASLDAMTTEERVSASRAIVGHTLASPVYDAARTVLLFAPMPGEPDLSVLIERALDRGKQVLLPRTRWAERAMDAARVVPAEMPPNPSRSGSWRSGLVEIRPGLFQPADDAPGVDPREIDLVFVPGLAFDAHGRRLGRGAGFYDRFLGTREPDGRWCGVAFARQVVGRVPTEPHDQPVTDLLTESGWQELRTDR